MSAQTAPTAAARTSGSRPPPGPASCSREPSRWSASPGSGFFQCVVANAQQLGYRGRLIPVNPARQEVYGLPSVSRVSDADQQVDLAAISVKAAAVEDVIADALAAGVRAFVLHTAGFAETGAEGEASQDRLRQMCLAPAPR